jgi:hypothetical protein
VFYGNNLILVYFISILGGGGDTFAYSRYAGVHERQAGQEYLASFFYAGWDQTGFKPETSRY